MVHAKHAVQLKNSRMRKLLDGSLGCRLSFRRTLNQGGGQLLRMPAVQKLPHAKTFG